MNTPFKTWTFDDVLQSVPAEPVVINKDYIVFTDKIKSGLVVYQTGTSKNPLNGPRQPCTLFEDICIFRIFAEFNWDNIDINDRNFVSLR